MKKCNKLLIIISIIVCFVFNNNSVFAVDEIITGNSTVTSYNGKPGNPGTGNNCGTGNLCYSTSAGIRITLVNEDGKRCHLNGNNACDSENGKESISNDYWYLWKDMIDFSSKKNAEGTDYTKLCYAYSGNKKMKSEFIKNKTTDNIALCTEVYSTGYDLKSLGFPEPPTGKSTVEGDGWLPYDSAHWEHVEPTEIQRNSSNISNIINYLNCSQIVKGDKFEPTDFNNKDQKLNCNLSDGTTVREKVGNTIINNIIRMAFQDDTLDVENLEINGMYLQIEQLTAIQLDPGPGFPAAKRLTLMGTVAEVMYLYNNLYNSYAPTKYRYTIFGTNMNVFCDTTGGYNNSSIKHLCYTGTSANVGIINGFYAENTVATGMSSVVDSLFANPHDFMNSNDYFADYNHVRNGLNIKYIISKYYQDDTANVFAFWINPEQGNSAIPCTDAAKKLAISGDKTDEKKYYESIKKIIEENSSSKKQYSDFTDKCFPEGIDSSKDNYGLNMNKCYQISYDYVKYIGVSKKTGANYCEPSECRDALNTISDTYGGNPHSSTPIISTKYDEAVQILLNRFAEYFYPQPDSTDLLNYSIYSSLRKEPDCATVPDCPTSANVSCEPELNCLAEGKSKEECEKYHTYDSKNYPKYNTFTIKDSDKCIKDGVSYSYTKGKKIIQSSIDRFYNSNVYCSETIDFLFPGKPKEVKSGTLLSWGVEKPEHALDYDYKSNESNAFGTMKITRKCYLNEYNADSSRPKDTKLNTTWYKSVSPNITLKYKDGIRELKQPGQLITQLKSFKTSSPQVTEKIFKEECRGKNTSGYSDLLETEELPISECIMDYVCTTNNCSEVTSSSTDNSFTTVATFEIIYGNDLKWFADKTDQYEQKNYEEIEKDEDDNLSAQYLMMGYGMPTSLFTGSCNYNATGKDIDDNDITSDGNLSITIENLGSKTDPIDSSKYHFNTLLHMDLVYDESGNLTRGITDDEHKYGSPVTNIDSTRSLVYDCPFKIQNNIFGYEDGKIGDSVLCNDESKGLDVVFRTIRLMDEESDEEVDKAFPGRTGNGRSIGYNWLYENNELYSILYSGIYNEKEPLYHIELTPSKIMAIREDNNTKTKKYTYISDNKKNYFKVDPYTNMDKIVEIGKSEDNAEDTYLFKQYFDWDNILKVYDYDGDGELKPSDAMHISQCQDDSEKRDEEFCSIFESADPKEALKLYSNKQAELIKENTFKGSHAVSLYLDTLRENYGLDGLCMKLPATDRLSKYSNTNGCNYDGRLLVYNGKRYNKYDLNKDGKIDSKDWNSTDDDELRNKVIDEYTRLSTGG